MLTYRFLSLRLSRSPATPRSKAAQKALISNATAQLMHQHWTFLFQLVLFNRYARFIRWDRSSAVATVTEPFDFESSPGLLSQFFWRFAHMSDEQRGWDTTVSSASAQESDLFYEAVEGFLTDTRTGRQIPKVEKTVHNSETYPVWKVRVSHGATGSSTELVIKCPFYTLPGKVPFGRATRAYLAYDLQAGSLVFMKDTWRDGDMCSEFETYRTLQDESVSNVPVLLYGGDVAKEAGGDEEEKTSETRVTNESSHPREPLKVNISEKANSSEMNSGLVKTRHEDPWHWHHRIVQDIAYPLSTVKNERELLQVFSDVFVGTWGALSCCTATHKPFGQLFAVPTVLEFFIGTSVVVISWLRQMAGESSTIGIALIESTDSVYEQ